MVGDLPVMFWVHGGGFTSGTGEAGNDLARLGEVADVVVVSINYRVGPLGFTCLPTDEAAGNMGMLDMVKALEWVQTHIHKFGGDPEKVTIFGESAGSASIGHLVLSPLTDVCCTAEHEQKITCTAPSLSYYYFCSSRVSSPRASASPARLCRRGPSTRSRSSFPG